MRGVGCHTSARKMLGDIRVGNVLLVRKRYCCRRLCGVNTLGYWKVTHGVEVGEFGLPLKIVSETEEIHSDENESVPLEEGIIRNHLHDRRGAVQVLVAILATSNMNASKHVGNDVWILEPRNPAWHIPNT